MRYLLTMKTPANLPHTASCKRGSVLTFPLLTDIAHVLAVNRSMTSVLFARNCQTMPTGMIDSPASNCEISQFTSMCAVDPAIF